jgi:hypothetical protein
MQFPIVITNHWFLFAVCLKAKVFAFCDSLYDEGDPFHNAIRQPLVKLQFLLTSIVVFIMYHIWTDNWSYLFLLIIDSKLHYPVEYSCNSSHVLPNWFYWIPNKISTSSKARQQVNMLSFFFIFNRCTCFFLKCFLTFLCFYVLAKKPVMIAVCSQWNSWISMIQELKCRTLSLNLTS